jgi:multiple sugar transport system permease protein
MAEATQSTEAIALPKVKLAKRMQRALGQDWSTAYVLMAPTVILMGGLIAYPFLRALYISFTNTTSRTIGPFIGLTNYVNLWKDIFFRRSVVVTAKFTLSAVALKFVVGLLAAILLNRLGSRATFWTGLVLLPWIIPDIVRAITWKSLVDPLYGGLSRGLVDLGIVKKAPQFLTGVKTALPTLVVVNLWQGIPFFTINILAGLKAIDQELYEAAAIDGASPWRQFLHITLPGLRYVIIVVTLLSTIWTFNSFGLIFLLTGGGPMDATKVYSILAFSYAIAGLRYGPGIAVAMTMAPILAIFIVVLGKYMMSGRRLYEEQKEREPGVFMQFLGLLAWPFRMLIRLLVGLFWLVNGAVEWIIEAIGGLLHPDKDAQVRVKRRRRWVADILPMTALILLLIFELAPFYWVIVTAFKTELQITRFERVYWPLPWTMDQFVNLFGPARNFLVWLRNTVTVSLVTPTLSTLIASAGAYALTRLRWKGANLFSRSVLVAYLMPGIMMLIPIYGLFTRLRLINTLWALFLSYPTFGLPFAIWLMMGYYSSIPEELEAAALIDGCNRFQTFYKVVLPLTKPALAAVAMFGITEAWSEFMFAYVMINTESKMTIPVGLAQMIIGDVLPWGELCAAALIMAIPVLTLYSLGQRFMVAGLTAGAVKGGG